MDPLNIKGSLGSFSSNQEIVKPSVDSNATSIASDILSGDKEQINRQLSKERIKKDKRSLSNSAEKLLTRSFKSPLEPKNVTSSLVESDVYITDWKKSDSKEAPNVVFKPGKETVLKAKICAKILKIVPSLERTTPPAKLGKVGSLVSRYDYNKNYEILKHEDGELLVLENDNERKEVHYVEIKDGITYFTLEGKRYCLAPTEDEGVYNIKKASLINKKQKFEQVQDLSEEEEEELEEEAEPQCYLVPKDKIFTILEHEDIEYIKIHGVPYKIIEGSNEGYFKLEPFFAGKKQEISKEVADLIEQEFVRKDKNSEEGEELDEVLVPANALLPMEDPFSTTIESKGIRYKVKQSGTDYTLSPLKKAEEEDFADESFVFVKTFGNNGYIIPEENQHPIIKEGKERYVLRNGQKYKVEKSEDGSYKVIGRNIEGVLQLKVEDICTKALVKDSKSDKMKFKDIDVRVDTPQRKQFYERIDMASFINAFLATMLLRPQDAKLSSLPESNYLFRALPNEKGEINPDDPNCKLEPVLIDLEETIPINNKISQDPDKVQLGTVHPIRNGLLALPHSRKILNDDERLHALNVIKEIIEHRSNIINSLEKFKKDEQKENNKKGVLENQHIDAFNEVFDKLEKFYLNNLDKDDWTLEKLFFDVFPEYEEQWNLLGNQETPEYKAQIIGNDSIEEIKSRLKVRSWG